jgi:hypothetical protein
MLAMPAQSENNPSTLTEDNDSVEKRRVGKVETLMTWTAPSRIFQRRSREFWTTVGSIAFLAAIIFAFMQQWLVILLIASFIFVTYVFSIVEPEELENKLTNRGVYYAGQIYPWEELDQYWIEEKSGQKVLNLQTHAKFLSRLQLLLDESRVKEIEAIIAEYLPEETPEPSFMDKASDWLSEKIPLDIS